eukprot:CAMPEP_0114333560 /NCGR_PEP_ID=MMETSP0101-20121206/3837_1 /TAXON_ID=38822 ORGANISM="Pteridomonas danica, Strain PT" /NCGR_SAMPLE_ID=MMETSP0101 /ASSEMBLY_ACC=CAM_ASM_000211 /LENGTH=344 /DNA_ID=CAMNT_0001464621 /DNA_START=235 /DNA_END=1269 /DNA_ORIENTATION=-
MAASLEHASDENKIGMDEVQLNGIVAVLVASKMFGTSPQLKVHDLFRLAPHLRVHQQRVGIIELTLIQTLQFNLFIHTTIEFSCALVNRLLAAAQKEDLNKDALNVSVKKYISYLDSEFAHLEYRQSEKARAVVQCAIARWSVSHIVLESKEMEADVMKRCLDVMNNTKSSELFLDHIALEVHRTWFAVTEALPKVSNLAPERRLALEAFILTAIAQDEASVYPTLVTMRRPAPLAPIQPVEDLDCERCEEMGSDIGSVVEDMPRRKSSIAFSSLATTGPSPSAATSPIDVADFEREFVHPLKQSSDQTDGRNSVVPATTKRLDLGEDSQLEDETTQKRQRVST